MPSYTDEPKEAAPRMLEECGGSVTRAMRRLGYPSRQTLCQWINQADASHTRGVGRPWSHHGPALKDEALRLVGSSTGARDVAGLLGIPGAAVVHNWARCV